MKISQLKSLIKESIKEVLKENEINTINYQKLKSIYTLASKLKLYEPYIVDETIEDMRRLENAVKTNDESVFEELEESQVDTYELSGLANLNPEQQARWRGIDIALRELSRIIYKTDLNLIGEKFKKLAVAINNFKDPVMQERRKMPLKEDNIFDTLTSAVAKSAYRMIRNNINLRSDVKTEVEKAIKAANNANPEEMISDRDARRLLSYGFAVKNSLAMMER